MKVKVIEVLNAANPLNSLVNLSVPFSVAVQMQRLVKQINIFSDTFNQERDKVNAEIDDEIKILRLDDEDWYEDELKELKKKKEELEKSRNDRIIALLQEEVEEDFVIVDFTKLGADVKVSTMTLLGIEPFAKFEEDKKG
jgi:hypothetical protein